MPATIRAVVRDGKFVHKTMDIQGIRIPFPGILKETELITTS